VKMADRTQLELIQEILATATQLEVNVRRERVVAGLKTRAARGQWMWRPPLGYLRASVGGTKTLIPDPERARFVRQSFDLYASGRYDSSQVLEIVRSMGLRTARGRIVSRRTFSSMLRNPAYLGRLVVPRWEIDIPGNWQPLVDAETFGRVQRLLESE
jgi:site-specific DNA recombinase